jgi:hypothetical protein
VSRRETGRYGIGFWVCLLIGWGGIGFGVWSLVQRAGATRPAIFAGWFLGMLVAHDLLVVPVVAVAAVAARDRVSPAIRGALSGALAVSAILAIASVPALAGFGRQPDNPSLLPRNYVLGVGILLALVWVTAALVLLSATRHAREPAGRARPQMHHDAGPNA